jgi:CxxC-x17-CxxC domain-containing protein
LEKGQENYDMAEKLRLSFKFREALSEYQRAKSLGCDSANLHYKMGLCYMELWTFQEALKEFDLAIQIDGQNPRFLVNKGVTLYTLRKFDDAIREFDNAISISPDTANFHRKKGFALSEIGKYKEANLEFDKAIALKPNDDAKHDAKWFTKKSLRMFRERLKSQEGIRADLNQKTRHQSVSSESELKPFPAPLQKTLSFSNIIIPMAIVEGTIHLSITSREKPYQALIKAMIESGNSGKLDATTAISRSTLLSLTAQAIGQGLVIVSPEECVLSETTKRDMSAGSISSALGITNSTVKAKWAVDLSTGNLIDVDWVNDNKRLTQSPNDFMIEKKINTENIKEIILSYPLQEVASKVTWLLRKEIGTARTLQTDQIPNFVDYIDDWQILEVTEVAIPVCFHSLDGTSRYLVNCDAPQSIVRTINTANPEILATTIEMKGTRQEWVSNAPLNLLGSVESFLRIMRKYGRKYSSDKCAEIKKESTKFVSKWLSQWDELYTFTSDVAYANVCIGSGFEQGEALRRIVSDTSRIAILTSFLNTKYVEWVAEIMNDLPVQAEALILYGHANDETTEEQNKTSTEYGIELRKHLRKEIAFKIVPTTIRTHEKIIVCSNSYSTVGSWNLCSSSPSSDHAESTLMVRSSAITHALCDTLSKEADSATGLFLKQISATANGTLPHSREKLSGILEHIADLTNNIKPSWTEKDWAYWYDQIIELKDALWSHFDSPRITLVEREDIRDIMFEQVAKTKHTVLIASDRVTHTGLDAAFASLLLSKGKHIRIVWGMEDPEWELPTEDELTKEIEEASQVISTFTKASQGTVKSSAKPMCNHSKVLVIDEDRFLITSDNLLAHGQETDEESSREIGVLVESPLLARKILGKIFLHVMEITRRLDSFNLEEPWDMYELARKSSKELFEEQLNDPTNLDHLFFGIESRFYEFNKQGKIITDEKGAPIISDHALGKRWAEVLEKIKRDLPAGSAEDLEFLRRAHENIGLNLTLKDDQTSSAAYRQINDQMRQLQPEPTPLISVGKDVKGRDVFEVRCYECGELTRIPFAPVGNKKYYCEKHLYPAPVQVGTDRKGNPLYLVKCEICGESVRVPFVPRAEEPVYCFAHKPETTKQD